jgi:hypothetical protein
MMKIMYSLSVVHLYNSYFYIVFMGTTNSHEFFPNRYATRLAIIVKTDSTSYITFADGGHGFTASCNKVLEMTHFVVFVL